MKDQNNISHGIRIQDDLSSQTLRLGLTEFKKGADDVWKKFVK